MSSNQTPPETSDSWCRKSGRRNTPSRKELTMIVSTMPDYFDAEQLLEQCRKQGMQVSRATVYRTLPLLCQAGVLRVTAFDNGRHLYAHRSSDDTPQAEIYIVDCGKVLVAPAPFLARYAKSVTAKAGLELVSQRLQTFARCPKHNTDACSSCRPTLATSETSA
ncbi:MAG: transcriptional repressor [Verrucomicrobia bacterium]|nr:transcriptional repressor [Verrucomicrobiota bacterium]